VLDLVRLSTQASAVVKTKRKAVRPITLHKSSFECPRIPAILPPSRSPSHRLTNEAINFIPFLDIILRQPRRGLQPVSYPSTRKSQVFFNWIQKAFIYRSIPSSSIIIRVPNLLVEWDVIQQNQRREIHSLKIPVSATALLTTSPHDEK
jgi:hypothetical protein